MNQILWLIALGLTLPTPQARAASNLTLVRSPSGELVAARKRRRKRKRRKRRKSKLKVIPPKAVKKVAPLKVETQPNAAPSGKAPQTTEQRDCVALADLVIAPELGTTWAGLVGQRVVGALAASKGFAEILTGTSLSQILDVPQATATDGKALTDMRVTSNCKAALRVQATRIKSKVELAFALAVDGDLREANHFVAAAQPPEQDWFEGQIGVLIDPTMKPQKKLRPAKSKQAKAPPVATTENTSDLMGSGMMLMAMGAVGLGFAQSISDDAHQLRAIDADADSTIARSQSDSWKVSDRMAYGGLALVAAGFTMASWSAITHERKAQP
jgi:hypothetical protein